MIEREQSAPASQNKLIWLLLGGCTVILICTICVIVAAVGVYFYAYYTQSPASSISELAAVATVDTPTAAPNALSTPVTATENEPVQAVQTPIGATATATTRPRTALSITPPAEIDQRDISPQAHEDLEQLWNTVFPHQDYYDTAVRLGRKNLGARTITRPRYQLNDRQTFQTNEGIVDATLVAETEHVYFWLEEGLDLDPDEMTAAANYLEIELYPRLVNLFGQEWQPGVDNDPHFSVLHLVGSSTAEELGYFTNVDEYPRTLFSESNEQEAVYLNMAQLELGSDLYYGTLVHEIQHLIQWYVDPNETTWLNEGLSQLAELYVGLDTADSYEFEQQPDIQLNSWSYGEAQIDAHYAAAYLHLVYVWEQLGEPAVQELSRHPANGLAAVRSVLQGYRPDWTWEQFIAGWVVANFLDDPAAGPSYYYQNLEVGRPVLDKRIDKLAVDLVQELNQFGTHYMELNLRGPITITFAGDTVIELIDSSLDNAQHVWFVPGVDDTDAQLTAEFDLTGLETATLRFNTWYDLEEDYDFAYVTVSVDGGSTWDLLVPGHAQAGEFGPAFNGRSADERDAVGGWLKESISLNSYVGQTVLLRFEVITDYETDHDGTGQGFALDDISIPELDEQSPANNNFDLWQADGFVWTGLQLPQQWVLQLIEGGPTPRVSSLPVNHLNQGEWTFEIGKAGGVLAITPLTPFVDGTATYWLHITD